LLLESNLALKFGTLVPSRGYTASPRLMARVAREAEALGYDYVAIGDHIHLDRPHAAAIGPGTAMFASGSYNLPDEPLIWESMTTLAYLAALTEKIELATHVLLLPARANPVVLAKQIACVDALSGGRLLLGLGVGSPVAKKELEDVIGVRWAERGRVADEFIQAMLTVWTTDVSSFHGKYVSFEGAVVYPKPARKPHPPIWIGGNSDAAIRRAARWGDGLCPPTSSGASADLLPRLTSKAREYGRNDAKFDLVGACHTTIAKTSQEARKLIAMDPYAKSRNTKFAQDQKMSVEDLARGQLVGSPDEMIKSVQPFVDAGYTHFHTLHFYYDSEESLLGQMRLFAQEVMPSFR
jgi:probable F420-dependent oxidoreductase